MKPGDLWIESCTLAAPHAALSGPVVGKQEVLVFAGQAEFEVPEGAAGRVKGPDAHQEQDDISGDEAGDVLGVLEGQTGHHQVTNDDSSHGPPALLLTGVKEDDSPEHVEQDDGHGHEG